MILRLAYYVSVFNVSMDRVINCDQTGIILIPSGNDRTYDIKGKKDISVVGGEEKRAYTAVVGSTAAGKFLPFQAVWKGETKASLPNTREISEEKHGFVYSTNVKNHWSNLATTKEYFEKVLMRHMKSVSGDDEDDPYWVALIDCWKIHKSKAFLDWAREKYPKMLILFVPAGTTGKFQPADLLLQRVLKHVIRLEFNNKR